jgi:hypothetical protein
VKNTYNQSYLVIDHLTELISVIMPCQTDNRRTYNNGYFDNFGTNYFLKSQIKRELEEK